jgi:predicted glycoside hydrolase/deacetylase ChbG (UPF0249 family)
MEDGEELDTVAEEESKRVGELLSRIKELEAEKVAAEVEQQGHTHTNIHTHTHTHIHTHTHTGITENLFEKLAEAAVYKRKVLRYPTTISIHYHCSITVIALCRLQVASAWSLLLKLC